MKYIHHGFFFNASFGSMSDDGRHSEEQSGQEWDAGFFHRWT